MILDTNELNERLNSPNNLLNRLKEMTKVKTSESSMNLFVPSEPVRGNNSTPFMPNDSDIKSTLDEIDDELRDGLIKNTAKTVLGNSLVHLSRSLGNIENPVNYARIATDMGKLLVNMETANKSGDTNNNQQEHS